MVNHTNGSGNGLLNFEDFFDLLKQLVRQPAVVGAEEAFFRVLQRELEEAGATVSLYEGLLVAEGKQPQAGYISAHIDRHGLICTGPNEFQYAAFVAGRRGDLVGDSVSEETYHTITGRFWNQPVQAYEPWSGSYLGQGTIQNTYLCERRGSIIFELEGLDYVLPGTPVAYLDRLTIEEDLLYAQLDNVLMATMLVYLYQCGYEGTAFFTAQEEAGRSWRFLLEWFRRVDRHTNRLLVLDTSPYPDRAAAEAQQIVLRHRDAHARFDPAMVASLEQAARQRSVAYVFKDDFIEELNKQRVQDGLKPQSLGSTELGRLITASDGEIRGATLQIPTTGYHTPSETASLSAVTVALELLLDVALNAQLSVTS